MLGTEEEMATLGPSRDLESARSAFDTRDIMASRAAHDTKGRYNAIGAPEKHGGASGDYNSTCVYGGLNGIVTAFCVIAACHGADLEMSLCVILGFACLIADGIAHGFGDYLTAAAELQYQLQEKARETWELTNYEAGEKKEMVELYVSKGMSVPDASKVIEIFSKHPKLFVDLMMVEELGMLPPEESDEPWRHGVVTLLSFVTLGSLPLWTYVLFLDPHEPASLTLFIVDAALSAVCLFIIGCIKGSRTNNNALRVGCFCVLNGLFAATAAFSMGLALKSLI